MAARKKAAAKTKPEPDFSVVSINGKRARVEVFHGHKYVGHLRLSLEESEKFLAKMKTAGIKTKITESPAVAS